MLFLLGLKNITVDDIIVYQPKGKQQIFNNNMFTLVPTNTLHFIYLLSWYNVIRGVYFPYERDFKDYTL